MKDLRFEYYVEREGHVSSMYDVQLADDEENFKNIEHLIEHPEDIACTLVEIYSSADKCKLKIYDTVEKCFRAYSEYKKKENESRFSPSYERIVKLYRCKISIEDEIIIE